MEGSGLILLTIISVLRLFISVSVLVMLSRVAVLVLMTGIFVGVLTLIWSILMLECISKVPVDNGFNNLMIWIHVYVCCFYSFKYYFHWRCEYDIELVALWMTFKPSALYIKVNHVALEMFKIWQFHDIFTCEVVDMSCLMYHK